MRNLTKNFPKFPINLRKTELLRRINSLRGIFILKNTLKKFEAFFSLMNP